MESARILVTVSGGIAAYKVPELVRQLQRQGHEVRCAATPAALRFVSPLALQALTGETVRSALFDPSEEGEIDHIRLADWADLVIVAPHVWRHPDNPYPRGLKARSAALEEYAANCMRCLRCVQ